MQNPPNNVSIRYSKGEVVSLITIFFLFCSCVSGKNEIREKATYYHNTFGWYGPATSAIDGFTWTYYRVPESTEELLEYIDRVCEIDGEYAFWGDAEQLKEDFKNNTDKFVTYKDSCFYYSPEYNGMREGVCQYSPKYLLETMGKKNKGELVILLDQFHTAVYDKNGEPLYFDYKLIDDLNKEIKQVKENYQRIVVRTDFFSERVRYQTLFTYERSYSLRFEKLDIPDSVICVYDKDGKTSDKAFEDISTFNNYLRSLEDVLNNFLEDNPEVHKVIFFAPLCF